MKKKCFYWLFMLVSVFTALATFLYGLNLWGWWYLIPVALSIIVAGHVLENDGGDVDLISLSYFLFSVGVVAIVVANTHIIAGILILLSLLLISLWIKDIGSFQLLGYLSILVLTLVFSWICPPKYMSTDDIEKKSSANIVTTAEPNKQNETKTVIFLSKGDTILVKHSTGDVEVIISE